MELLLTKSNPIYGTLFRYAIATGQNYMDMLQTTVADVKEKDTITIQNFSYACKEYKVYLDQTTKMKLAELCVGKADTDYIFCGRDASKPLPRTSFQNALAVASESLGLENITPYSLRKTHFLHLLKQFGVKKVMKIAGYKTPARAYEFLRLAPDDINVQSREDIIKDSLLLIKDIQNHLSYIESITPNPYNNDLYYSELHSDLVEVNERLKRYNTKII